MFGELFENMADVVDGTAAATVQPLFRQHAHFVGVEQPPQKVFLGQRRVGQLVGGHASGKCRDMLPVGVGAIQMQAHAAFFGASQLLHQQTACLPMAAFGFTGRQPHHGRHLFRVGKIILRRRLHFGEWTLDTASRELIHASQATTPLGVSGYALLLAFLEHPYETLSREHLSRVLKREYMPYDRIIDVHVSQIRRTLGKQADGSSFIKTLRSQGYVFVADVEAGR